MPRLRTWIKERREAQEAEQAAANYDPRDHRTEVAGIVRRALVLDGFDHVGGRRAHEGPLGGESDDDVYEVDTPVGRRRFRVVVYAMGVFAPNHEDLVP